MKIRYSPLHEKVILTILIAAINLVYVVKLNHKILEKVLIMNKPTIITEKKRPAIGGGKLPPKITAQTKRPSIGGGKLPTVLSK